MLHDELVNGPWHLVVGSQVGSVEESENIVDRILKYWWPST